MVQHDLVFLQEGAEQGVPAAPTPVDDDWLRLGVAGRLPLVGGGGGGLPSRLSDLSNGVVDHFQGDVFHFGCWWQGLSLSTLLGKMNQLQVRKFV